MPTFPGEVCDLIIDQMGVPKEEKSVLPLNRDLTNCAMVCRGWIPRSRMNQFESLNFAKHSSYKRLSPFLDLLSSPHATIAPHSSCALTLSLPCNQSLSANTPQAITPGWKTSCLAWAYWPSSYTWSSTIACSNPLVSFAP
ncbi:hypothetical protein FIBSPDRAFT_938755 [Athelia psychrophila]|uniref:F-box domain-containing protein n=1 Tax=Athelia psychrophila TaxID=1759441 RepID=A0A165XSY3_9AGAM|nr:hypothetical protein FIBSPDRAFT_938755 [Fibularhizoctonia sp. CBS 109695]